MNNTCYNFKNLSFNSVLFDSFVDMTYVLIMENSKREKNMYKELNLFKPTSKVKIQYKIGILNTIQKVKIEQISSDIEAHGSLYEDILSVK